MPPEADETVLWVTVVRSGGLAGLTRRWHVEPPASDTRFWEDLIDECPWQATRSAAAPTGADRFAWTVSARCGPRRERVELTEGELGGPWRVLVDAVRAADPLGSG